MILGIMDNGEYYLASDGSAIVEHTKTVEYLKDQEMVEFSEAGYVISSLNTETPITREHSLAKLDFDLETIEKGGYKHCKWLFYEWPVIDKKQPCQFSFTFQLCLRRSWSNQRY